jgi:hypothetical protein
MLQVYSYHQAYLQSLVELYMLNVYAVWDPSSETKITYAATIANLFLTH